MSKISQIQSILGVTADGQWGTQSQAALDAAVREAATPTEYQVKASSFADPRDVAQFRLCKSQGKSDQECFKVGDNGIGKWGDDTTNVSRLFVALHVDHLRARWGSVDAGHLKPVSVTANGKTMLCEVGDICGVRDRIDLAPGAQFAFGLTPPFLVAASWRWPTTA